MLKAGEQNIEGKKQSRKANIHISVSKDIA